MSISRRQFFRGLVGQNSDQSTPRQRQTAAVDAYIRTNLLPYDFGLTAEQTEEALVAGRNVVNLDSEDDVLRWENRLKIREIVDPMVDQWRNQYLKAEDVRRDAAALVGEFLSQASPEDLENLRRRFHIPYPAVLQDEVERQIAAWLGGLSNEQLANSSDAAVRDLVLSELRSWC